MAVDLHNNTDQSLLPSILLSSLNKPINTIWSDSSGSVLSSPVESELGSTTETEESNSDEDYIPEFTHHQMAQYMNFQVDDDNKQEKSWGFLDSLSPQSTLRSKPMMEEFEKMKINNDIPNPNIEFQSRQARIDDQVRAIQFYKLKQEQAMKQQQQQQQLEHKKQLNKHYQNKGRACIGQNQKTIRPSTTQQQQPSSGMRAVFLGGSGSRTESCGTGVFLPRAGISYSSESRNKKPGCATVLIPARVVHALKQHFDKVGVPSRFNVATSLPLQHDSMMGGGERNNLYSSHTQQQQQQRKSWTVPAMNHHHQEIGLPQEWTY